jgi:hypothetical protein
MSYVDQVRERFPDKAELLEKVKHHNKDEYVLPSSRPSLQRMRLTLNGKHKYRKYALKEARTVETEHAVMLQYLDVCTQELNLHTDLSNFRSQSSVASKAILVIHLLRAIRANWIDPGMTVDNVATANYEDWVPHTLPKTIMGYYIDYRRNNCTGFTESQQGRNHRFTILLDAHPDRSRR